MSQNKLNVGILFANFGPYHVARIEALNQALNDKGQLTAFRFSEGSNTYGWVPVQPREIPTETIAERPPKGFYQALILGIKFWQKLKSYKINLMFLPSISPLPNFFCLIAAKVAGCKIIIMSESWKLTQTSGKIGQLLKNIIIRLGNAALVGGTPQKNYISSFGMAEHKIFVGYDVIDTEYFRDTSQNNGISISKHFKLPEKYFLNLGRFVYKKNLLILIEAYANLLALYPTCEHALVLVGEGELKNDLIRQIKSAGISYYDYEEENFKPSPRSVLIYPFQQHDVTPGFFTNAEAFVLPSIYEEWGLVINEAQACGCPVIVSCNVGSAVDLVDEEVNGFIFHPENQSELTCLLARFVVDPSLKYRLGIGAQITSTHWSTKKFGENAVQAIEAAIL